MFRMNYNTSRMMQFTHFDEYTVHSYVMVIDEETNNFLFTNSVACHLKKLPLTDLNV
mgnify:CR=1 FL=1